MITISYVDSFSKNQGFGTILAVSIVEMIKRLTILFYFLTICAIGFSVTKTALRTAELKKEIKVYIAEHYPGFAIHESYKVNTNGTLLFEVTVVKNTDRVLLIFNKDGLFVNQKVIVPLKNKKVSVEKKSFLPHRTGFR